jgi:hypothetical protein
MKSGALLFSGTALRYVPATQVIHLLLATTHVALIQSKELNSL